MSTASLEQAQLEAERAGLTLLNDEQGLALTDGSMTIWGDFTRQAQRLRQGALQRERLRQGALQREMLVKAARVKGVDSPIAVDATAGLGDDSLLLAAAGFHVVLFERNPVIAALLRDAIKRAAKHPDFADIAARMQLVEGNSIEALPHLDIQPDVVLLDPMFPTKHGDARAKKKLQLIQRLEQPCEDEAALLEAAFAAHPRKIVVKRPLKGPFLANRKPSYSLRGKTIRYDCFVS